MLGVMCNKKGGRIMWGNKIKRHDEFLKGLEELERKMDRLLILYGDIDRLQGQNRELFDRLMSRNWEDWAMSPAVEERLGKPRKGEFVLSPTNDESNAGGILSDDELGRSGK